MMDRKNGFAIFNSEGWVSPHRAASPIALLLILFGSQGCTKQSDAPTAQSPVPAAAPPSAVVEDTPKSPSAPKPGFNDTIPALPALPAAESLVNSPPTVVGNLPAVIEKPAVPEVIKPELVAAFNQLLDPNLPPEKWEKVHFSLVEAGSEAVPVLKKEMSSADLSRREQASSLLALLGPASESAILVLLKALEDDSAFVRANSAAALASFAEHQERAKSTLVKMLDSNEPELRRLAASNLSLLGDAAADLVPRLTLALDDADNEVVKPIAQLLGQIGDAAKPAVPRLQKIAFEKQGEVKDAATLAVELIERKNEQR